MIRTLTIIAALGVTTTSLAAEPQKAIFGAGCFWCAETAFEDRPGVIDVVSGYSGGTTPNPTYEAVAGHATDQFEVVEVTYDPAQISYEQLLYVFWRNVDPLQADGQFCDRGNQYRSAIFAVTPEQRAAAEASKAELEASRRFSSPIVTIIADATPFYAAEDYHQNYAKVNPLKYEFYRYGCGRDAQLDERWGPEARAGNAGH